MGWKSEGKRGLVSRRAGLCGRVLALTGLTLAVLGATALAQDRAARPKPPATRPPATRPPATRPPASAGGEVWPAIGPSIETDAIQPNGTPAIEIGGNCRSYMANCTPQIYPYGAHSVQMLVLHAGSLQVQGDLHLSGDATGVAVAERNISVAGASGRRFIVILAALPRRSVSSSYLGAIEQLTTQQVPDQRIGSTGGWSAIGVPTFPAGAGLSGVANLGEAREGTLPRGDLRGYLEYRTVGAVGGYAFVLGRYQTYNTKVLTPVGQGIRVGSNTYVSTLRQRCSGGYQLVEVLATTLKLWRNTTYQTNCPNTAQSQLQVNSLGAALRNASVTPHLNGPLLVFLQTLGKPLAAQPQVVLAAEEIGAPISALGGSAEVWERAVQADDGYALVGSTAIKGDTPARFGPHTAYAAEAATVATGHPANLQGLLRGNFDWHYLPVSGASIGSTVVEPIATMVYDHSASWPTGATAGQRAILLWLSNGAPTSVGGPMRYLALSYNPQSSCYDPVVPDVRFEFCDTTVNGVYQQMATLLQSSAPPQGCGCTPSDWTAVSQDVRLELGMRSKALSYLTTLQSEISGGDLCAQSNIDLQHVAQQIENQLAQAAAAKLTGGFWTDFASDIFNAVSSLFYTVFPDGSVVANVLNNVSSAGYLTGDVLSGVEAGNSPGGEIDTAVSQLGTELENRYCTPNNSIGLYTDAILSNYGSLQAASGSQAQINLQSEATFQQAMVLAEKQFVWSHLVGALYRSYTVLRTSWNPLGIQPPLYRCPLVATSAGMHPWGQATDGSWLGLSTSDPGIAPSGRQALGVVVSSQFRYDGLEVPHRAPTPPAKILAHLTGSVQSGGLGLYPVWLFARAFPQYSVACNSSGYDIWGPNGVHHFDHHVR